MEVTHIHPAALANALNSSASDWAAMATAHAVLASACTLKSLRCSNSAALANAASTCALDELTVANAHAVLASPCT